MKKKLLALTLAACAVFAVNVSAEEAAADVYVTEPLVIEGLAPIKGISSDSSVGGTQERIDTDLIFDGLSMTGCSVEFLEAAEGEEIDETIPTVDDKSVTVFVSTRVPTALEAVSLLMDAEKGSLISVELYATNDNLLLDWTQLSFENLYGDNGDFGDYQVFFVAGEIAKYTFYRIDLKVIEGTGFTLNELDLYKDAADTAVYTYESFDYLEAGDTPELILVTPEEPAEEEKADEFVSVPAFGIGSLPGMLRPVPYRK